MEETVFLLQNQHMFNYTVEVLTSSVDLDGSLKVIADSVEPEGHKHSCGAMHINIVKKTGQEVGRETKGLREGTKKGENRGAGGG